MLKTYLSAVVWLVALAVVYGYVCPFLISAPSTLAVLIGFAIMFGSIPTFWHFGFKIARSIINYVKEMA